MNSLSGERDADRHIEIVRKVALDLYNDPDRAREFLEKPHPMLAMCRPIDVAQTNEGAEQVLNILGRAAYGGGV